MTTEADNPYLPINAVVEEVIDETPTIKTLVLRPEHVIPFVAGQFMDPAPTTTAPRLQSRRGRCRSVG